MGNGGILDVLLEGGFFAYYISLAAIVLVAVRIIRFLKGQNRYGIAYYCGHCDARRGNEPEEFCHKCGELHA